MVPTSALKPYEKNAKKHPTEQVERIANSIREFGFRQPLVIAGSNEVVAGHGRLLAAIRLELAEVPCVLADDLTDEQIRAYRLVDNRTNESDWDVSLLGAELAEIVDLDMADFGFDLSLTGPDEVVEDEFNFTPPEQPKTKRGDRYRLGDHVLMCGDSTDAADVAELLAGAKADMLLTDPPYNVAYEGKTKGKLKLENDEMQNEVYREFLRSAFYNANETMKQGGAFYIWHADSEGYTVRGACQDVGWAIRQCLIWNKNSMVMGRQDYHWKHEPCLYGWKEGASHLWAADRRQTTVLDFDRPTRSIEHPTMKPVRLFDYLIKNNTKGQDVVLDLFAGSGTSIIACEQNGRVCYAMELDPRYCDVAVKRWEQFTGKIAELLNE